MDDTKDTPPEQSDNNKKKVPPSPEYIKQMVPSYKSSRPNTPVGNKQKAGSAELDPTTLYLKKSAISPCCRPLRKFVWRVRLRSEMPIPRSR